MHSIKPPIIRLKKYGHRAYHVLINGGHWGNVCGYEDRRGTNTAWTSVWFSRESSRIPIGRIDNRLTRSEAIKEIVINTAPDRVFT